MRGVNKVTLVGNLGRDPDIQYIEGEIPVAKFPLATTEMRKERNGNVVSETEWHTVVLWRGLAELAGKYLHKGSLVYIEGRLRTRTWEDKDKNRRFQTEIVGENLVMLEKRRDGDHDNTQQETVKTSSASDNIDFGFSKDENDIEGNTTLPF
ncbi:single-stranded DNA-binding protein [Taibaiella koreensis]|uniref:single-stranded DNA-binding protein n=1 Tax=Taibaiella koreensis TaxID=1268548 RepID=UPI000E59F8D4|nr:single-stranded DNA-binding protein [Taibaiella koreensis]